MTFSYFKSHLYWKPLHTPPTPQLALVYSEVLWHGWLMNKSGSSLDLCADVLQEGAVKNAPLFLRYLTEQMHERVPSSLILWYDSVIENGKLQWQNELNQSNRRVEGRKKRLSDLLSV